MNHLRQFGFCLAACAMGAAAESARADWIVRHVADGTAVPTMNVDVMVLPEGEIAVGYAMPFDFDLQDGEVRIARLGTYPVFSNAMDLFSAGYAAFDADRYGNIHYTARGSDGIIRVGSDLTNWGGGLESIHLPSMQNGLPTTIAIDQNSVPAINFYSATFSRFDVPSGTWMDESIPTPLSSMNLGVYHSMTFDSDNTAVMAYVHASSSTGPLVVARRNVDGQWDVKLRGTSCIGQSVSIAAAPEGGVGIAYRGTDGSIRFGYDDGVNFVSETVGMPGPTALVHRSLAYDPDGNPAIVYGFGSETHLARRNALGQWTEEILPVSGTIGSIDFDAAGNPYIAVASPNDIWLLGTNLPQLYRGDFNFDTQVTSADAPGFVHAIRDPNEYRAANPGLTGRDVQLLGDYSEDDWVTKDDARIFLDSLSTTPSDDLTTRKAGFIAFDAADLDPETGSGLGNLFDTELATGKEYQHGDSRGDITGLFDGIPDEMVDESDIDYVFSHLNGSDARLDFNGDSLINSADIAELVQNILGTTFGDSDLDGDVDLSDLSNLAANYGQSPRTWTQGNFDGDNDVDLSDLSTLATYYGNGSAEAFAAFQSLVPEPACIALLPLAGMVLTRRRR